MEKKFMNFDVKAAEENERSLWFTASTSNRDRDGDIIIQKDWKVENYLKNPVFLWAHDYSRPPIGKGVEVDMGRKRMGLKIEFVPGDIDPFAEQVYQLYKGGFMSTVSVGFMPYKVEPLTEEDMKANPEMNYGRRISAELLELSAVPVPANPNALARAEFADVIAKGFRFAPQDILNDLAEKQAKEKQERERALLEKIANDLAAIKASFK